MKRNRRPTPTRALIIKNAAELFFQEGFSKTTTTEVCNRAGISKGNLTYYFPTKESMLAVLVQMMIDHQWMEMENAADDGKSSLLAYCLELTTLASMGEDSQQVKDFIIAAYSYPITLDLIRVNDTEKIKRVFAEYTKDWDEEKFIETETLISGIEYATMMQTEHTVMLEHRIEGALDTIMMMFGVPAELRKIKIAKVLAMDYRAIGRRVYENFKKYVTETNEQALDEILNNTSMGTFG